MGVLAVLFNYVMVNVLTLYYSVVVSFVMLWNYAKNPFADPWALKLRLEPPACLTDPKYGVHKYIKVNNTKLHYVESGDPSKPLMIFVHGFPEFWYSWRYQITEFNKDYWCIAVDMRGYGDSERPDGLSSYKVELLVEDIRDLVRNLGRQKCILISHDWGGLIACKFRDIHPDVVSGLVVLGSASMQAFSYEVHSNPAQRKMSWYMFFYRMPALPEKYLTMNNCAVFETIMLAKGKSTVTEQDVECYKYWFGKQLAFTPPINYYRANFTFSPVEMTRSEEPIPFLHVLAEGDAYLSKNLATSMKRQYATIETETIKDCGHFMQQEEPVKVNQLIRQFLNKNKI